MAKTMNQGKNKYGKGLKQKKALTRKLRLGAALKRNRRMPMLAQLKTHRKLSYNIFTRDWRHKKLKLKG